MNSSYVKDFDDPSKDAANYKIGLYPAAGWTQDYARQALRTEMRLEKAMEGERFFDLVRWGIAKETMNNFFAAEKTTAYIIRTSRSRPARNTSRSQWLSITSQAVSMSRIPATRHSDPTQTHSQGTIHIR